MPIPTTQHGFTILELMIAVAVLAILLTIGVPSFTETIRSNRAANQTNELVTALNTARSEASKRGLPVTVCAANAAQTACSGVAVADWSAGWLTFTDLEDHGVINTNAGSTDTIILKSAAAATGIQVASNNSGFVRFAPNGSSTDSNDVRFTVRPDTCTGTNLRTLRIERPGRVALTKAVCP